jgi:DNA polymerase-3 subunit gamma/tau
VLAVLGVADEQLLAGAFNAVAGGDARGALLAVARCADGGRDAGSFTRDLEGRARELLIVQTLEEVPLELSLTPEIDERLRAQAQRVGRAEVVRVLDLLGAALEAVRAGADPRTQLELALVKAATPQTDGSTRALLARIERLEQALAGDPSPARPAPPPGPSMRPEAPPTAEDEPESPPTAEAPESSPTVGAPESSPVVEAPETPGVAPGVVEAPEQQPTAAPVAVATPAAVSDLDALWPAVHEAVGAEHGLLGAVLNEAVPATLTDEELVLAFPPTAAFHKRKAEDPDNRAMLADTLRRVSGRRYRVTFELREDLLSQEGPGGGAPTEEEVMARLMAELDAVELPEDWLTQQKGE